MVILTLISSIVMENGVQEIGLQGVTDLPAGYNIMSKQQRSDWLQDQHDGYKKRSVFIWGDNGVWGFGHVYNDGYVISQNDWQIFIDGEGDNINLGEVLLNFLTINIPMLEYLGFAGLCVRLILISCIVIGLVDILWIG